jgi:hypothetical protein
MAQIQSGSNYLAADPAGARRRAAAVRAAQAVAHKHGLPTHRARVLHDANNIVVYLAPSPIVAKVCPASIQGSHKLAAELEVAQHLVRAAAPIVGPSPELPVQPYADGGYAITFWRHQDHDPHAPVSEAAARGVLAQVHQALDSYPVALPSFLERQVTRASKTLADPAALSSLAASDRAFLCSEYSSIIATLCRRKLDCRALHGDPHRGNLLVSKAGCLMIDFESVCSGPVEWDLSALPGGGAGAIAADQELLALLQRLRSLCVAVWCWSRSSRFSELDRAAEAHFNVLRVTARASRLESALVA